MRAAAVLLVCSLLLALLLVEGGLRMHAELRSAAFVGASVPTDDTQPDPLLVAWFKPDYIAPDGSASYDQQGFRLNGESRANFGPHPIVMVGGSTAYGWGSDDERTITAALEQQLRERGGDSSGAVVVNAGYPGLTTLDTLLVYDSKVAALHPSRVVLLAGLNDLYYAVDWLPANRLHWTNRTYEVALRARHEAALRPLVDAIDSIALRNCFTCYAFGNTLSQAYDRTHFMPALGLAQELGQEPLGTDNRRAMQLTAWTIGELARRVRADGGCLFVAWQPMAGVPDGAHNANEGEAVASLSRNAPDWPSLAPRMFAELSDATRPVFARGEAVEVDLTHAFDRAQGTMFIDDGVHYSAAGNALVAQALEPALATRSCSDSSAAG